MKKRHIIDRHAASLTLYKASEPTCQLLTALTLWTTHGFDKAMQMSSPMLLNEYKFMKKRLKRSADRLKNPAADVMVLPSSPWTLRKERRTLYDQVFSEEPPVACPLDASMLEKLAMFIPMRSKQSLEAGRSAREGWRCEYSGHVLVAERVHAAGWTQAPRH